MPGVRIRHATARSCVLTVVHPRRYKAPFLCPTCKKTHLKKTYHPALDEHGCCIVTPLVLQRLREAGAVGPEGFQVENEVTDPPTIRLNLGKGPVDLRLVEHPVKKGP